MNAAWAAARQSNGKDWAEGFSSNSDQKPTNKNTQYLYRVNIERIVRDKFVPCNEEKLSNKGQIYAIDIEVKTKEELLDKEELIKGLEKMLESLKEA